MMADAAGPGLSVPTCARRSSHPSLRAGFGAAIQDGQAQDVEAQDVNAQSWPPLDCHAASAARNDGAVTTCPGSAPATGQARSVAGMGRPP